MSTFADSFETPVTKNIAGKEVTIKRLTTRDYLPWLEELTIAQRERDTKLIPPATKPVERFKILRNIAMTEVTPDDVVPVLFTAAGTLKILDMALKKAGVSPEDAISFEDSQSAKENEELAGRLSGLLSAQRLDELYGPPPVKTPDDDSSDKKTFGDHSPNAPAPMPGAA